MSQGNESFVFPVSFAQQRLWFLHQLAPDTPSYNCGGALRISAAIDPDLLRRSVNEIIRRHEVLRTTFQIVEGRPVQIVRGTLEIALPVTRAQFEEWISEDTEMMASCVDGLLARVGVEARDVDQVFLTGGSSLVPAVRRIFETRFGAESIRAGGELISVASGLALRAGQ